MKPGIIVKTPFMRMLTERIYERHHPHVAILPPVNPGRITLKRQSLFGGHIVGELQQDGATIVAEDKTHRATSKRRLYQKRKLAWHTTTFLLSDPECLDKIDLWVARVLL